MSGVNRALEDESAGGEGVMSGYEQQVLPGIRSQLRGSWRRIPRGGISRAIGWGTTRLRRGSFGGQAGPVG